MLKNVPATRSRSQPPSPAVSEEDLQRLVELFQVLADPTRLRMVLTLIQEGEQHVSALCNRLNQLQPAVSFHLGRMFRDGILRRRRQGKFCYYSLAPHFLRESLAPFFANGQDQIRVADLVLSLS